MTSSRTLEMIAAPSAGFFQSLNRLSPKPEISMRVIGIRDDFPNGPKLSLKVFSIGALNAVTTVALEGWPPERALRNCTGPPSSTADSPPVTPLVPARMLSCSPPASPTELKAGATSENDGGGTLPDCERSNAETATIPNGSVNRTTTGGACGLLL